MDKFLTASDINLTICDMRQDETYFIRSAALTGYCGLAAQVGVDPLALLRRVRIDPKVQDDPDTLISFPAFVELLEWTASESGCSDFGLRLSQGWGLTTLGPVGLLAQHEPDVWHGIRSISRYLHLHNEGIDMETEDIDGLLRLSFVFHGLPFGMLRQMTELTVGIAVKIGRLFWGEGWNPDGVYFVHAAPVGNTQHKRIFRAPVWFDQEFSGLTSPLANLYQPLRNADSHMRRYLLRYVESLNREHGDDLVTKTRRLIRGLISSGRCSEELIADYLALQPRTLQRKLKTKGYSFQRLTDEVRMILAIQHLSYSRMSLTEIAEILGYSELSAFSRFFRRQFGKTPSAWRAENRPHK